MREKVFNKVEIETIPEVAEYERVLAVYNKFRKDNPTYFRILDELLEELNSKMEAAEKVVRSRHVSCGSFHLFQKNVKVDSNKVYDIIGRERFLKIGGEESTIITRRITKEALEAAVQQKLVDEKEIAPARTEEDRYHAPGKIILP